MKKDMDWLNNELEKVIKTVESDDIYFAGKSDYDEGYIDGIRDVQPIINQLDEPEVLSQEVNIDVILDDLKGYVKEQQSLSINVGMAHTPAGNDTHYRQYDFVLECIGEYEPSEDLKERLVLKQEVTEEQAKDALEEKGYTIARMYDRDNETVLPYDFYRQVLLAHGYLIIEKPVIPKFVAEAIEKDKELGYDVYDSIDLIIETNGGGLPSLSDWVARNIDKYARAWLDGYEVEEEQKYYAKIKGWELFVDFVGTKYWGVVSNYGRLGFVSIYGAKEITKDEWVKLGINEDNADFIKAEELEE